MVELLLLLQVVTLPFEARPRDVTTDPCRTESCQPAPSPYRLHSSAGPVDDPVARAMHYDWSRCGLSGMPVCPSKRRVVFHRTLSEIFGG